jgi:hypothetical protein
MRLVQIEKRSGTIAAPPGEVPVLELRLDNRQRVLSCELSPVWTVLEQDTVQPEVNWDWVAYIETELRAKVEVRPRDPLASLGEALSGASNRTRPEKPERVVADSQRGERFVGGGS